MAGIDVEFNRGALFAFRARALECFPNEALGYLLGRGSGQVTEVLSVWIPDDLEEYTSPTSVEMVPRWTRAAEREAERLSLSVVGTIHTHPYEYRRCHGRIGCRAPSEGDWDVGWEGIAAIMVIAQQRDGRLKTSTKCFGPGVATRTKLVGARRAARGR